MIDFIKDENFGVGDTTFSRCFPNGWKQMWLRDNVLDMSSANMMVHFQTAVRRIRPSEAATGTNDSKIYKRIVNL